MNSSFNTSKVTRMSLMFEKCKEIKDFSFFSYFDTVNVTYMLHIFQQCKNGEFFVYS